MNLNYGFLTPMPINYNLINTDTQLIEDPIRMMSMDEVNCFGDVSSDNYERTFQYVPMTGMQTTSDGCVSYDSGMQAYNLDLRREVLKLRSELADSESKRSLLEAEINELRNERILDDEEKLFSNLNRKLKHATNFYSQQIIAPNSDLPTDDPCLLARIDSLLRNNNNRNFIRNCQRLIGGFYPAKSVEGRAKTARIMHYLKNTSYVHFLNTYYDMLIKSWDASKIVAFMSHLHMYDRGVPLRLSEVTDITREKYKYNDSSCVGTLKIDAAHEVAGDDHIYNRHSIDGYPLSMLHALSHIDAQFTGRDLAKYHVGNACRMNECSIIEILDCGVSKTFKPFKCYDSYAILPLLPGEVNGRVEATLHHSGQIYVTLVRCYDERYSEYLVENKISPEVSNLAFNYRLNKFDVFFSNEGMCIRAAGMRQPGCTFECCGNAFQNNSYKQRSHKQPSESKHTTTSLRSTEYERQRGDKGNKWRQVRSI